MAYEPTVWKSGDVVTSAKLNKIEQGIANAGGGVGGVLIAISNYDAQTETETLDKTWQEIHDAAPLVWRFAMGEDYSNVSAVYVDNEEYHVVFGISDYVASTADGYPVGNGGK